MIENNYQETVQISTYKKARFYLFSLLIISCLIQFFIGDFDNSINTIIIFFTSFIVFYFILRPNIFTNFLLPSFVILSFNISILSGPLIIQSLFFTPVTFNLKVPFLTFGLSSLYQFSMMLSLFLFRYLNLFKISNKLRSSINKPLGIMSIPTITQLWTMGFIGLSALIFQAISKNDNHAEFGDAGSKFIDGLVFLAYAPFLIPIIYIIYLKVKIPKKAIIYISIYFFALLLVSLGINSRGSFANGITTLIVLFLFFILTGQLYISKKLKRKILLSFISIILIAPIFSDLATAMVIARAERGSISSTEMVKTTFEIFLDKERIKRFDKNYLKFTKFDYEEAYLNNPFLDRFINVKFFDNMFSLNKVIDGNYSEKIIDVTINKLIIEMPTPLLNLLGINLNKEKLLFSMGDYLVNLENGLPLGGFKVGSTVAHGFSMFGYLIFLFMIPIYLLFFSVIHSFTIQNYKEVFISPVMMLLIMKFYFISFNDSFIGVISLLIRGLIQSVILYLIIYHITKLLKR